MKAMLLIEIYTWLKCKHSYWITILVALLIGRIFLFTVNAQSAGIAIMPADVILVVIGGLTPFFSLIIELPSWLMPQILLIILARNSFGNMGSLDVMLLVKSASKAKWWLVKMLLLLAINSAYTLVFFLVMSLFFLQAYYTNSWGEYTQTFFPQIAEFSASPLTVILFVYLTLFTGFLAITSCVQTIGLFFKKDSKYYLVLISLFILLAVLCRNNVVARQFSPMHYPSTIDIVFPSIAAYWGYISFNIAVTVANVIFSLVLVIFRDLVVLGD